jgi:hypothetical protein
VTGKAAEWPASLDALIAAPQFHSLILENDDVRVLSTRVGPGEMVPLHTHCWPSVLYVVASDHVVRRDEAGNVLLDSRVDGGAPTEVGTAIWTGSMAAHTVENVGESEVRLLNIELKPR